MNLFLQGGVLGFSIAAAVGPIGVLCIRRSIADGCLAGFVSGMGAATADACFGGLVAAGVTGVADFVGQQQFWFTFVGGIYLCWLGGQTFCARPAETAAKSDAQGLLPAYLSTFVLTLMNPMTILFFASVFSVAGLGKAAGSGLAAATLVAGVFLGSALWWLILSLLAGALRARFDRHWQHWLNRISGVVIGGFGFWHLSKLVLR